ncbi:hypothetical protein [Serratia entomophila]|uniref:hypothetical protein n=1 Tax=Serratia entomophila TaxID=42906 RepID=UPI0021B7891F|nr:hypothetical protein [Serratia entomophila]
MSSLKSRGSKLGKVMGNGALFIVEALAGTALSIAAFAALFLFDKWWKGLLTAGVLLLIMGLVFSVCSYAKGERQ